MAGMQITVMYIGWVGNYFNIKGENKMADVIKLGSKLTEIAVDLSFEIPMEDGTTKKRKLQLNLKQAKDVANRFKDETNEEVLIRFTLEELLKLPSGQNTIDNEFIVIELMQIIANEITKKLEQDVTPSQ